MNRASSEIEKALAAAVVEVASKKEVYRRALKAEPGAVKAAKKATADAKVAMHRAGQAVVRLSSELAEAQRAEAAAKAPKPVAAAVDGDDAGDESPRRQFGGKRKIGQ